MPNAVKALTGGAHISTAGQESPWYGEDPSQPSYHRDPYTGGGGPPAPAPAPAPETQEQAVAREAQAYGGTSYVGGVGGQGGQLDTWHIATGAETQATAVSTPSVKGGPIQAASGITGYVVTKPVSTGGETVATSSYSPYMGKPGGLVTSTVKMPFVPIYTEYREINTPEVLARAAAESQRTPTTPMQEFLKEGYIPPIVEMPLSGTTRVVVPARPTVLAPAPLFEKTRAESISEFMPQAAEQLAKATPIERLGYSLQTAVSPQWGSVLTLTKPEQEKGMIKTIAENLYREKIFAGAPDARQTWLMSKEQYSEAIRPITEEKTLMLSQALLESGPGQVVTSYGAGVILSPFLAAASPLLAKSATVGRLGKLIAVHPNIAKALSYAPVAGIEGVKVAGMASEGKPVGEILGEVGKDVLVFKAFTTGMKEFLPGSAIKKPAAYKITEAKGLIKAETDIGGKETGFEVMGRSTRISKTPVEIPKSYKGFMVSQRTAVGEQGLAEEFRLTPPSDDIMIATKSLQAKTTLSGTLKAGIAKVRGLGGKINELGDMRFMNEKIVVEQGSLKEALSGGKAFTRTTATYPALEGVTLRSNVELYLPTEAVKSTGFRIPAKTTLPPMKPFAYPEEAADVAGKAAKTITSSAKGGLIQQFSVGDFESMTQTLRSVPVYEQPIYYPSVLAPFAMPKMEQPQTRQLLGTQTQQLRSETNQIIRPLKLSQLKAEPVQEQKIDIGPQLEPSVKGAVYDTIQITQSKLEEPQQIFAPPIYGPPNIGEGPGMPGVPTVVFPEFPGAERKGKKKKLWFEGGTLKYSERVHPVKLNILNLGKVWGGK